jgi:hypothetical protein
MTRRAARRWRPSGPETALLATLVLLLPATARAWGPAAHLDFGSEALRFLALAVPFVRRLLQGDPDAFLLGGFLADSVIGKNRAPEPHHSHRWMVGRSLLAAAGDPAEASFSVGYLAHLAADEVAHREFVPAKLVDSFEGHGLRHVYWELRFDSRVLQRQPAIADTWRRLAREPRARLEHFLAAHLHPALLPHPTSRGLFAGGMTLQRGSPWIAAARRIDRRSAFTLGEDEFDHYRKRAVDAVLAFLGDPECERGPEPQPVGLPEIREAQRLRRALRAARRRKLLPPGAVERIGPILRIAVAEGRPLADAVAEATGLRL